MSRGPVGAQFVRYAIVGLASNGLLYAAYLVLTAAGLAPKVAMTLMYVLGVAQTFLFNKRWSFRHAGLHGPAFIRYCVAYALGYLLNVLALVLLVDQLGYPHALVQGVMILALAVLLFVLQRSWVFREPASLPSKASPGL